MKSAEIIVLCGKVGSGKTTYAKELQKNNNYMYFSVDEWMLHIHGRDIPCQHHQEYVSVIKEKLFEESIKLLNIGVSVIFDFGFWTKTERDDVRQIFKSYHLRFIYLQVGDDVLKQRVANRNIDANGVTYIMSEETRTRLSLRFEEPINEPYVEVLKFK